MIDAEQRAYLPAYGEVDLSGFPLASEGNGDGSRAKMTLGSEGLWHNGKRLAVEPALLLGSRRVELVTRESPIVSSYFPERVEKAAASIASAAQAGGSSLEKALESLPQLCAPLESLMSTVLRRVVLFDSPSLNSFVQPAAYGCVFINVSLGDTEVFFVEDLVHQVGHLVLMAACADWSIWFNHDPRTLDVGLTSADGRSLYTLWHGAVTEALMVEVLGRWLGTAPDHRQIELEGRYAFAVKRFRTDLQTLAEWQREFTPMGLELAQSAWELLAAHVRHNAWVKDTDVSNQGYNYSHERFLAAHSGQTRSADRGSGPPCHVGVRPDD